MTKVCHNVDVVGKSEGFQCVICNIESFDNVVPEDVNDLYFISSFGFLRSIKRELCV